MVEGFCRLPASPLERQAAAFSRGRLWVARGHGRRAAGGDNRDGGRRAAQERRVRERAAEHVMLPAEGFILFRRGVVP